MAEPSIAVSSGAALRINRHNHVVQCYVISVILRETEDASDGR